MELQRYAVERGTVGNGAREHTINARNVSELIWTPGKKPGKTGKI
jgi:hypothetical protein